MNACTHLDQIHRVEPKSETCEECAKLGENTADLRLCLTCGHVGCSDASPHQHAKKHFEETGHPVVESIAPGQDVVWCYVDQIILENA